MNNVLKFLKCANCGACYNACPVSAISVKPGLFYEIMVDENKCMDCGLCTNICPVNNYENRMELKSAYAGYNIDLQVVNNSSSGGAFYAIANYVIEKGGVVFGAAYSNDCKSVVFKSTEEVTVKELMRSKYVESKVGNSFARIKEFLISGRTVLFCGAPCQVAGLKRYLCKEYENLITCDFSCEGMASNQTYVEYLESIEKKFKSNIKSVNFRAKIYGWSRHSIRITCENGKEYKNFAFNDPYFYSFIGKQLNLREYCTECEFAENHYSDIILADFWAYKRVSRMQNDDTGLSLVITNSQKGNNIINDLSKKFITTKLDLKKASYNMKKRNHSEAYFEQRKKFFDDVNQIGFMRATKKIKKPSKFNLSFRYKLGKIKNILR